MLFSSKMILKKSLFNHKNIFFISSRKISFPLILSSGFINFFALSQMWNPFFPRTILKNIIYTGNFLFLIGLILPSN
jgi:hypothetical protein